MTTTINASTSSGLVNTADTSGILQLQTASTAALTIDTSQNVGIGNTSPADRLQIEKASANCLLSVSRTTGGAGGRLVMQHTDSVGALQTTASVPLTFGTNDLERMRIDSSGNVLVGTTSNNGRISANGSSTNGSTNTLSLADSGGTNLFYVRTDGLINTGTKSASPYNNTTGSAANMFLDNQGTLYRSTSSIKYKTDIQDATHGLAEVLQLRPVTYKGKADFDGDKVFGGLIAEEVDAIGLTEFVQYADDGSPDALAYGQMVALCIKSIQELNAKVEAQALEIQALKGAK
jgi:hypothetical protein